MMTTSMTATAATTMTTAPNQKARRFWLQRHEDASGVSGIGYVAEGVIFRTGKVVLSWLTAAPTIEICDSISVCEAIHGHGGKTVVVYEDDDE
jgi:hypothetical protein